MTFDEAKEKLKEYIQPDGGLHCLGHYLAWDTDSSSIRLDCVFEIDELDAIVTYMRGYASNNLEDRK